MNPIALITNESCPVESVPPEISRLHSDNQPSLCQRFLVS